MPILSDVLLARLSRMPGLRLPAARKAAARALHAPALAAAPGDPVVLARLDLLSGAATATVRDRAGRAARDFAVAVLAGDPAAAPASPAWRRRFALDLARRDPAAAARLLVDEPRAAAACLLAAGECEAARRLVEKDDTPEALLIRAAVDASASEAALARDALNRLFVHFGLAPPLASRDAPPVLDAYRGEPQTTQDGPLVSVIVPLFDGAATVEHAVTSLLRQSWRAIEVVVCDDGSHDDGPARVATMAARDPRIRLIRNQAAPGVAGARNHAILAARGAFLAFLDADDWAHPERIARQMAGLGANTAGTVSAHYRVDDAGVPIAPRVVPVLRLCPISMLVRADVLVRVGPFDGERAGTDAEMLGRLDTVFGRRAMPRDRAPLTVARWRARSISNDPSRGLFEADRRAYRERWMRAHARLWRGGGLPSGWNAS